MRTLRPAAALLLGVCLLLLSSPAPACAHRPGVPSSPQHLSALIRHMRAEKIRVILLESWYPAEVSEFVARETGAHVVVVPQTPGAVKGTEDYISHIDYLVNAVASALAGS